MKSLTESKDSKCEKTWEDLKIGDIFYVCSETDTMEAWYILKEWDQEQTKYQIDKKINQKIFNARILEHNSWDGCSNSYCDHQLSKNNYKLSKTDYIYIGNYLDYPEYFL